MEKQSVKINRNGRSLIILGFTAIGILFLIYSSLQSPSFTTEGIASMERLAIVFYIAYVLAFGAIGYGLYRFHVYKATTNDLSLLSIIAANTFNKKSRKIFLVSFIAYGIFFSLTSGILVYQPEVVFSYHYNAVIPSAHITPCCGEPGYMPKIIVYLTEHVGLQIIPINLLLQIVVSYLVGLNVALAVNTIKISKKTGGLTSIGATTGLFIACPTCVGTFLSLFVSSTSAIVFTLAITQFQTLLILVTIPILLVTPFILARKLKSQSSCEINPD